MLPSPCWVPAWTSVAGGQRRGAWLAPFSSRSEHWGLVGTERVSSMGCPIAESPQVTGFQGAIFLRGARDLSLSLCIAAPCSSRVWGHPVQPLPLLSWSPSPPPACPSSRISLPAHSPCSTSDSPTRRHAQLPRYRPPLSRVEPSLQVGGSERRKCESGGMASTSCRRSTDFSPPESGMRLSICGIHHLCMSAPASPPPNPPRSFPPPGPECRFSVAIFPKRRFFAPPGPLLQRWRNRRGEQSNGAPPPAQHSKRQKTKRKAKKEITPLSSARSRTSARPLSTPFSFPPLSSPVSPSPFLKANGERGESV